MAEPKEIEKKGMGKDKGSRKFEKTSAADRQKANTDGKFGYFDEANRRFVPAFIDMIDGGDRDNRGDDFAGGPLSGILNALGVPPYGSLRDRPFGGPSGSPIQQAVAGGGMSGARPQIKPSRTPAPSYANMDMGEAGRGSMPPDTPLPYANMNMGEAGRGFMPPDTPLPYANMDMGEAGRGSMPPDTPLSYANMDMGEAGRGSMPADTPLPYANMDMGEAGRGSMPPIVSNAGYAIDPTRAGRIQAQRNIDNRERLRANMGQITEAEYNALSRAQKSNLGLPVRPLDLMFAGSDAFKEPMVGSGRGSSSGDADFDRFLERAANNPYMPQRSMEDMYKIYSNMKRSGSLGQFF